MFGGAIKRLRTPRQCRGRDGEETLGIHTRDAGRQARIYSVHLKDLIPAQMIGRWRIGWSPVSCLIVFRAFAEECYRSADCGHPRNATESRAMGSKFISLRSLACCLCGVALWPVLGLTASEGTTTLRYGPD